MSSNSGPPRRKNRWGSVPPVPLSSSAPPSQAQQPPPCDGVSDEDALQALLSETAAKERAKQEDDERTKKKRIDGDSRRRRDNDPRSKRRRSDDDKPVDPKDDYYGPGLPSAAAAASLKTETDGAKDGNGDAPMDKKKPDFGLSGALAKDQSGTGGSNVYKGVLLKFQEPQEARTPNTLWRFYVFKGEEQIDTLHVSKQSAYLFGRNEEIADIPLQHPSCSSQHAVLQYRALPHKETGKLSCQPYLMDLESTNGSFINGVRIDSARYYQLKKEDVLRFGASTREYVLLTANTKSLK